HADEEHHGKAEYLGVYGVDVECDEHHEEGEEHSKAYVTRNHEEGEEEHDHGACDPHVWTNPLNVMVWANNIAGTFGDLDEDNRDIYLANAQAYIEQLATLSDEMRVLIDAVPEENRVIVTNHNFLGYFAAEYGFEVVGTVIPSASSMAQVAPQDIAELIEVIQDEGVKAIFAEYAVSTDIAETVASEVGYDVAVVRIYSDSLGEADGEASTYLDMIRYNVTAIVNALKG
ncbi:MAG: zinc ABC transporter substrate-binding protein, partial [Anaerolineae bacterium]|nr:zinc ABC transporter substrate-binding protein [Anaerolineae bacterium]